MTGPEAFGLELRRARERKGLTLEQVSERTKVSVGHFAGLERGDISRWPAGHFGRAFVRGYAGAVGLDPEELVAAFARIYPESPDGHRAGAEDRPVAEGGRAGGPSRDAGRQRAGALRVPTGARLHRAGTTSAPIGERSPAGRRGPCRRSASARRGWRRRVRRGPGVVLDDRRVRGCRGPSPGLRPDGIDPWPVALPPSPGDRRRCAAGISVAAPNGCGRRAGGEAPRAPPSLVAPVAARAPPAPLTSWSCLQRPTLLRRNRLPAVRGIRGLPRPVWMLGITSLCTDTASEAVYPLLPIYLTRVLGAGAVSLGLIEGFAEATSSLLKILSGHFSDRWKVRRPIVIAGYGLSSAVRPLTALVTSWPQLFAVRFADRVGKGVRGAPRDAILAACATPANRGLVFGFHRAMDHAGAVLGPVLASLFLLAWPGRYRLLFALTLIPGALAVASLFLVKEQAVAGREAAAGTGGRGSGRRTGLAPPAFAFLRAACRPPRLRAGEFGGCLPAAAADRRGRRCRVHPAAVGRAARGEGVDLGVGRSGRRIASGGAP